MRCKKCNYKIIICGETLPTYKIEGYCSVTCAFDQIEIRPTKENIRDLLKEYWPKKKIEVINTKRRYPRKKEKTISFDEINQLITIADLYYYYMGKLNRVLRVIKYDCGKDVIVIDFPYWNPREGHCGTTELIIKDILRENFYRKTKI